MFRLPEEEACLLPWPGGPFLGVRHPSRVPFCNFLSGKTFGRPGQNMLSFSSPTYTGVTTLPLYGEPGIAAMITFGGTLQPVILILLYKPGKQILIASG